MKRQHRQHLQPRIYPMDEDLKVCLLLQAIYKALCHDLRTTTALCSKPKKSWASYHYILTIFHLFWESQRGATQVFSLKERKPNILDQIGFFFSCKTQYEQTCHCKVGNIITQTRWIIPPVDSLFRHVKPKALWLLWRAFFRKWLK